MNIWNELFKVKKKNQNLLKESDELLKELKKK